MHTFKRIQIIINPASGGDEPILNTLNDAFKAYDVDWDVNVTRKAGDGTRFARAASETGVDLVMSYGGDGTLLEIATGLIDTETPLAILPGGTANALHEELGLPSNLADAALLPLRPGSRLRAVDVGQVGDHYFLIRIGTGMVGEFSRIVTREMKDRFGLMAYIIGGLQTLTDPPHCEYTLTIDGETLEAEGVACLVSNASATGGQTGVRISSKVKVDDGLFDVFVARGDPRTFLEVVRSVADIGGQTIGSEYLSHWQGKEITIDARTPQSIYADGENDPLCETPATIKVLPGALKVVVAGESVE